jgi:hypothetical protein
MFHVRMSDINLPAHLLEVLDIMSREMGVPRDALVSQAIYQLARLNGYVVPGKLSANPSLSVVAKTASSPAAAAPMGLKKRAPIPEPEPEEPPAEDEEGNPFDDQVQDAPVDGDEPLEEQPADEEPQEEEQPAEEEPPPEEEEEPAPPPRSKGLTLVISMAGREPYRMAGDQVLLGRGKHCDFVIESNRVSREHARFSRKGADFFIEDLGSSNGTFVGAGSKEKLTAPRKLKDGDDVTFGTEKVKVAFKK